MQHLRDVNTNHCIGVAERREGGSKGEGREGEKGRGRGEGKDGGGEGGRRGKNRNEVRRR